MLGELELTVVPPKTPFLVSETTIPAIATTAIIEMTTPAIAPQFNPP